MRKRIHNPKTHKYYALQQRDGERRRGQIKGKWVQKRFVINSTKALNEYLKFLENLKKREIPYTIHEALASLDGTVEATVRYLKKVKV